MEEVVRRMDEEVVRVFDEFDEEIKSLQEDIIDRSVLVFEHFLFNVNIHSEGFDILQSTDVTLSSAIHSTVRKTIEEKLDKLNELYVSVYVSQSIFSEINSDTSLVRERFIHSTDLIKSVRKNLIFISEKFKE